jgi:hypothetical protein
MKMLRFPVALSGWDSRICMAGRTGNARLPPLGRKFPAVSRQNKYNRVELDFLHPVCRIIGGMIVL